jgi:hypothetical protein
MKIPAGVILSVASGKTLTINGPIEAGIYKIFSGRGEVLLGVGSVKEIYPEWWGTNTTPGTTDMSAALQYAINAANHTGQIIHLAAQQYKVSTILNMLSHVRLEGSVRIQESGAVMKGTELVQSASETSILSVGDNVAGWTLRNLTFRGTETASPFSMGRGTLLQLNKVTAGLIEDCRFIYSRYCIQVMSGKNVSGVNIHRCYFWYNNQALLLNGGWADSWISDSEFWSVDTAIYATTSNSLSSIQIYENQFFLCKSGINATNPNFVNIIGNRFNDIGGCGVRLYGNSTDISITGNLFINCGTNGTVADYDRSGINLFAASSTNYPNTISITGNVFTGCHHDIYLTSNQSPPHNSRIQGNAGRIEMSVTDLTVYDTSPVFYNNIIDNIVTLMGGERILYWANVPSTGTWAVGDRVINSKPSAGSPKSWVCTVPGTPGTWVSEGNL